MESECASCRTHPSRPPSPWKSGLGLKMREPANDSFTNGCLLSARTPDENFFPFLLLSFSRCSEVIGLSLSGESWMSTTSIRQDWRCMMSERFSDRHGFGGDVTEIRILQDFPTEHREAIIWIAEQSGVDVFSVRKAMVQVLFTSVDTSDWSPDFARRSMMNTLNGCDWWDVYDIAEEVYKIVDDHMQKKYTDLLNRFFMREGFGWEMRDGLIEYRGAEPFAIVTKSAEKVLASRGFDRAANEVREAMRDISRRPEPDITGAATHALGALEAVARKDTGKKDPLGQLIPFLALQAPLDKVAHKLWGFASNTARHMSEERHIDADEAEFTVTVACALATLIAKRHPPIDTVKSTMDADDLPFE